MSRYSGPLECKVYVGGLSRNASKDEIERIFSDFGKLTNVFVARNPHGFAFIEYEDRRDAEDAVKALDGRMVCGTRVRVELSHGKSRPKGQVRRGGPPRRRRSRSFDRKESRSRSRTRSRSPRREENSREDRDVRRRPRIKSRSRS
ncbi:unnamed protein product [Brachionus calyciflorus]|uniref:RRM domain-containing protein n=1 Tax=Brachionus calyciflorus TaxID=104777 RepID=A0A813N6J5_9BILA|nr:unnamed protein product [Brachionus calyciflorus]